MATLEECKQYAQRLFRSQVELFAMTSTLNFEDITKFNIWYKTDYYYKKWIDLVSIVRQNSNI